MTRNSPSFATLVLSLVLWAAIPLHGCSSDEAGSAAPIRIYTALEDDELGAYLALWREAHPEIEFEITRDSTGIIGSRLLAERDRPVADVVWGTAASVLLQLDEVGLLEGYAPEGLEDLRPRFYDADNTPPRWVGIKAWMTGFVCNTIELERLGLPLPTSYEDLLDPIYRNQIIMPNPASSGTGFLTVSGILQLHEARTGEESAGWEYLDRLHENIARYTHSGSKPAKLAGKGEIPIGISFGYRGAKQKRNGEPVRTMFPTEGSGWEIEANALVKKPAIRPEARAFLDWAISEAVFVEYAKVYPIVARPMEVDPPDEDYPRDPEGQLIENDLAWAARNRKRILEEWSRRYDGKSDPTE